MAAPTQHTDSDAALALVEERARLEHAQACLAAMRSRAEAALRQAVHDAHLDTAFDAAAIRAELEARVAALAPARGALTFGRIDEDRGDRFHVGRRHVEDDDGEPVVIDWRAAVAAPFYRATWADPMGLDLRRRFAIEGSELLGLFDEHFGDPDAHAEGGGVPDPLLIELERARSGEMRDIVATIQAEQDEVIRAPKDQLTVVQGGPGTGKTAVGLHRAAFLLYEHRAELAATRLLVVGPNPLFLAYISQVLPSLGEVAVTQSTLTSMLNRYPVRAVEGDAVAAVKGDLRMSVVIDRYLRSRFGAPSDDVTVMTAFGSVRFEAAAVAARVEGARARALPTNTARDLLRQQLLADGWKSFEARTAADPGLNPAFLADLGRQKAFAKLCADCWPALSGAAVVRALLTNRRTLAAAADGVLSPDEQALLLRKGAPKAADERWTRADLALLDEADARTGGVARTFGHIVVDEAQDVTDMELRALARRAMGRSMTVLGDLAQSTGVGGQQRWEHVVSVLGTQQPFEPRDLSGLACDVRELELGYRVPEAILEYANRLLPTAAPGVRPSRSVRVGGRAPAVVRCDGAAAVHGRCADLASEQLTLWNAVAVIAPDDSLDTLATTLAGRGVTVIDARRADSLEGGLVLLGPRPAKGLEFDAVLVVEPASIVAAAPDEPTGLRLLYVALTRAVQQVTVVHGDPLPTLLR